VDRMDSRLVNILTALGFALPVAGYFWLLGRYSVDAVFGDQWSDVNVIKGSYAHFFDWGPMWVQHFENRIFFPNIVVVILAHTVHFNIRFEEYLSAVMLMVATIFIISAHKRRSPTTPYLYYCPVAFLMLSVVQYGNTLWGFQLAWYMVMLSVATAILLLDRPSLTWVVFVAALVVGVVSSFSSLQGLLVWPTGLVLLYYRRRDLVKVGLWIGVAVGSAIVYFHNYDFSVTPDSSFTREHPLAAIKFFLFTIGDVVGKPVAIQTSSPTDSFVVLLGLLILVLAVATFLICGLRRDERRGSPVGLALICFGVLFAATTTQGRSFLGYGGASFSRYTTFDVLILVGIYLALTGLRTAEAERPVPVSADHGVGPVGRERGPTGESRSPGWVPRVLTPLATVLVLVAIVLQVSLGAYYGAQGARSLYLADVEAATVLRSIDHASDAQITTHLYYLEPAAEIRRQARVLREHRLSVFASG
jgi:hypothetical protein